MSKQRYSRLKPLDPNDSEQIAIHMLNFFSVLNNHKMKEILGKTINKTRMTPLSFGDFIKYCEVKLGIKSAHRFKDAYWLIINKLVNANIIVHSGNTMSGTPLLSNCFYFMKEYTNAEKSGPLLYLSKALGPSYIRHLYSKYMVLLSGENKDKTNGTGSGIVISKRHILTCKHNVEDLNDMNIYLGDTSLSYDNFIKHPKEDIAIIELTQELQYDRYPYFGDPNILDNIVTLGYPPVATSVEASLVSQKGEINTISKNWNGFEILILSSIVRPGNSGGPVISENGYIVGMVIQSTNTSSQASTDKSAYKENPSPFYIALSSRFIYDFLCENFNEGLFMYEDYE